MKDNVLNNHNKKKSNNPMNKKTKNPVKKSKPKNLPKKNPSKTIKSKSSLPSKKPNQKSSLTPKLQQSSVLVTFLKRIKAIGENFKKLLHNTKSKPKKLKSCDKNLPKPSSK